MKPIFDLSLYLVTDRPCAKGRDIAQIAIDAVKGGATIVQLREKDCSTDEFVRLAKKLKESLAPYHVPLIINDRIDVALAVDAEGVHIGQSDMPYDIARRLLGPDKIIGLSVENMREVEECESLDVDYIGISPVFATPTKTDTSLPFGLEGTKEALKRCGHRAVAIGGMNLKTVTDVMRCGVEGVAVVSAIVSAESPEKAAKELKALVDESRPAWSGDVFGKCGLTYQNILQDPFTQGLMDGTLPDETFKHFIEQDTIYLKDYAKNLTAVAELLSNEEEKRLFKELMEDGIEAEKRIEQMLGEKYGQGSDITPNPATQGYITFKHNVINKRHLPTALSAILPCFWFYNEMGKYMSAHATSEKYKAWIDTYTSPLMDKVVERLTQLADKLAKQTDATGRAEMERIFRTAALYELDFIKNIHSKR